MQTRSPPLPSTHTLRTTTLGPMRPRREAALIDRSTEASVAIQMVRSDSRRRAMSAAESWLSYTCFHDADSQG